MGTDSGLNQVYRFGKQSGGHVKSTVKWNEGSTVKIYLARLLKQQSRRYGAAGADYRFKTGRNVAAIEDDRDVRSYLAEVLRNLRYRVVTCSGSLHGRTLASHGLQDG
jgi:hypothetical protein